ncbi:hypothetical protein LX16_2985 [Stackebrandtia albiflava]|uniref:Uncharacterized protein n=1 Tax=Stackebrandtia albiflava TaxID=406432 RepID=A0A562V2V0_9ACTN|nr:hypothetical protein [Stackebrandtia albiflava]TWJ12230.1 hypothetical protein LX16_2985 [Stackebrandtia albiflava]
MDYVGLRDTDPATLEPVVAHWRGTAARLRHAEDRAAAVAEAMASGDWHGPGHDAATTALGRHLAVLTTRRAEADAMADTADLLRRRLRDAVRELDAVLAEIGAADDLTVDDSGTVRPRDTDALAGLLPPERFAAWRRETETAAAAWTGRIAEVVARADAADREAVAALRSVTGVP